MEEYIGTLLENDVFPGISILVARNGEIRFKKQYGCKSLVPQKDPLEEHTLYDLASLTKPLITAFLTAYLLENDKTGLSVDTKIRKVFPALPSYFDITLLQLLTHTSGLPAWYPFFLFGEDYFSRYNSLPLKSRPGKKVDYSCVGYILLYYFIEKVTGRPFIENARQVIIKPLGLRHTFLSVPEPLKKTAAPTEAGNRFEKKLTEQWVKENESGDMGDLLQRLNRFNWRTDVIQGETNDMNSHYLGGTAGNAGLFSTTEDIFQICREFFPAASTLLKTETLRLFWKNFTPFKKSHRTMGFKRNSSFITSGGRALSRKAIGHNGFTGTSVWLDPRRETIVILLTNRIHPAFKPLNFDKIRRKLHRLLL